MRVLAAILALMPVPAMAEFDPGMVEILSGCLDDANTTATAQTCIGVLSKQCMDLPNGQTTLGMMQCAQAETEAWDVLLNIEFQAAREWTKSADANESTANAQFAVRAEQLRAAQRAWIAFRDSNCLAAYGIYGAGSMRQIAGSQCHLQMTAERTIELRMFYGINR